MTTFTILKASGEIETKTFSGHYISPGEIDDGFTLDDMQAAVGGLIELVPHFSVYEGKRCVAFCNEEGKLKRLRVNVKATNLWVPIMHALVLPAYDMLVGDVLIITGTDEELARL